MRAEKSTRIKFKKFFHGDKATHFVFFQKDDAGPLPQTSYSRIGSDFDAQIVEANAAGQSVCMAINSSKKGKRTKENFVKVNAVFIDKDDGTLTAKEMRGLRPAPDLIVRSSPTKFHAYWLVEDCSIEGFPGIQKALAERFDTDRSVCDISRVMRMPGTFNPKYPGTDPAKIIHITANAKPRKLQALIDGLGLQIDLPERARTQPTNPPSEHPAPNTSGPMQPVISGVNERESVAAALATIPADDRKVWLHVGMALHSWDASDAGFRTWSDWSAKSAKYDAATQRSTWDGFKAGGGVTLGTLFHLAKLEQEPDAKRNFDESSLAEQFCLLYAQTLRFDPRAFSWYAFDGTLWVPGPHRPQMAAREMVATFSLARGGASVEGLRSFRNASGLKAIVNHAQLLPGMHIDAGAFDSVPNLLALKDGVVELNSGLWRPATPADWMSYRAPVNYEPKATCPLWDKFILEVVQDDAEYVRYLQRALGYSLFGLAKEQVFFLVIGPGGNGKGVLMRTIKAVLGQYAHSVAPNVLSRAYSGNPNSPSPALAPLQKARFVICTELPSSGGLDAAFVKQFAGGDELSARPNYGELVTFTPPGKLWISTNSMPEIEASDAAMWRRLVPLPFTANFRGKKANRELDQLLETEHAGILLWLLSGAAEYAHNGLGTCKAVSDCRKALKTSADSVQAWVNECCRLDGDSRIAASDAYASYVQYSRGAKQKPLSNREFPLRMEKKGFAHKRRSSGSFFEGLRLVNPLPGRRSG
ncbi:hypothetical protein C7T35_10105 [Variovorax sp. WS11]|uniref:phage/plasmid primase, P4 family n=1 Tax=Variovorax sp. WS11 TaxID=1105204 RepID=UPI000D0DB1F0|nr:phage/plasmid primase, P4 family [Variovorax sp. WS11]NDZ12704.1 hypothetical protein [Variovorax sp. WS11]PSL84648.1 hypothetical protein C7T35_10105 [Variovorax sp. WS11]